MTTPTPLTALERELLGYVEQLAQASTHSTKVLQDLEKRSNTLTNETIDMFTVSVSSLIQSQKLLATVLQSLVNESANLNQTKH